MTLASLIEKTRKEGAGAASSPNEILGYCAGNVLRIADAVRDHLSKRQSHGKPTIQHETVMSEIGEALARYSLAVAQLDLEKDIVDIQLDSATRNIVHRQLNGAAAQLSKLMGGHGYIVGSIAELEYQTRIFSLSSNEEAQ